MVSNISFKNGFFDFKICKLGVGEKRSFKGAEKTIFDKIN